MTQSFAASEFDVIQWADKVGITKYGTLEGQGKKLAEECQEVIDAIKAGDNAALRDGIGDVLIVLIMIGLLSDNDVRECLAEAAAIVTKRKGHMTPEGIFVKEQA